MKTYIAHGSKLILRRLIALQIDPKSGLEMREGILLPEGAQSTRNTGDSDSPLIEMRVASAGPQAKEFEGKIVLVNQNNWMEFPIEKQLPFYVLDAASVIAIVEERPDRIPQKVFVIHGFEADGRMVVAMPVYSTSGDIDSIRGQAKDIMEAKGHACAYYDVTESQHELAEKTPAVG